MTNYKIIMCVIEITRGLYDFLKTLDGVGDTINNINETFSEVSFDGTEADGLMTCAKIKDYLVKESKDGYIAGKLSLAVDLTLKDKPINKLQMVRGEIKIKQRLVDVQKFRVENILGRIKTKKDKITTYKGRLKSERTTLKRLQRKKH